MTIDDGLPPLREVISKHGLEARKALGQNFLMDLNLTGRIARSAGELTDCDVLEIGPGPGGLTRALLAEGARRLVVIERDPRCLPILEEISAAYPGRLEIVEGDALQLDHAQLVRPGAKVVANLPYNVGTALLTGWVGGEAWPPFWQSLTLMFQREVADRIVALPGGKAYGRLSVLCGWRTRAERLFDVSPKAFTPPPKVTSSIVQLQPIEAPLPVGHHSLEIVTRNAFGQRRKMLRASLRQIGSESLLAKAGIDGTRRAESLSVEEFAALAKALENS